MTIDSRLPPLLRVTIEELATLWQYDEVVAACTVPTGLEEHPELALRLRGAWGRALREAPPPPRRARHGAAWGHPTIMLTEPFARLPNGDEVPKPAVIRAAVERGRLVVRLRLFGAAMIHRDAGAEALIRALEGGFALWPGRRERTPVVVEGVWTARVAAVALPERPMASAAMLLRTPLVVRAGPRLRENPAALARSVVRRVAAMAYWQRCEVAGDLAGMEAAAEGLSLDARHLRAHRWDRHSQNGGDRPIPMAGHLGRLGLSGPGLARLDAALRLAETCNTGSHASLGLGAFDLAAYPGRTPRGGGSTDLPRRPPKRPNLVDAFRGNAA